MHDNRYGVREWNTAVRKVGLAFALRARLPHRPLEDIATKTLCRAVSISEATFYNYFPRKVDLVRYLARLHALDLSWHASRTRTARGWFDAFFDRAADLIQEFPWVAEEILCRQHLERELGNLDPLSPAERRAAYPDLDDIETVGDDGPVVFTFRRVVSDGVAQGQLPVGLDVEAFADLLYAVFATVPLVCTWGDRSTIPARYRDQLDLTWRTVEPAEHP